MLGRVSGKLRGEATRDVADAPRRDGCRGVRRFRRDAGRRGRGPPEGSAARVAEARARPQLRRACRAADREARAALLAELRGGAILVAALGADHIWHRTIAVHQNWPDAASASTACSKQARGARTTPAPICPVPGTLLAMPVLMSGVIPVSTTLRTSIPTGLP